MAFGGDVIRRLSEESFARGYGARAIHDQNSLPKPVENFEAMSDLAARLERAVLILVGEGPVKQRLVAAFSECLADLEDVDWPPTLRADFQNLAAALRRVQPVGKEGPIRASIQKMSFSEAAAHAAAIARLYAQLAAPLGERAEPLKVVTSRSDAPSHYRVANGS
jgi:hypothetical protein